MGEIMMKRRALFIVITLWPLFGAMGESLMRIRAWQLHEYDIEYCREAIDLAPRYDITHIVFSHNLIWFTEEMLYDKRREGHIDDLAERAHNTEIGTQKDCAAEYIFTDYKLVNFQKQRN